MLVVVAIFFGAFGYLCGAYDYGLWPFRKKDDGLDSNISSKEEA